MHPRRPQAPHLDGVIATPPTRHHPQSIARHRDIHASPRLLVAPAVDVGVKAQIRSPPCASPPLRPPDPHASVSRQNHLLPGGGGEDGLDDGDAPGAVVVRRHVEQGNVAAGTVLEFPGADGAVATGGHAHALGPPAPPGIVMWMETCVYISMFIHVEMYMYITCII